MEKRVLLAVVLSFAILAVYQAYFAPAAPTTASSSQAAATSKAANPALPPAATGQAAASTAGTPQPPAPATAVESTASDVVVDTDTIHAVFTTRGAVLKSWKLKHYFDDHHQPLELVPQDVPDNFARPFQIAVDDQAVSTALRSANYKTSADSLNLGGGPGTLTFEYQDGTGVSARKVLQFQPAGKAYLVAFDAAVTAAGKPQPVTVQWGPGVGLGYSPDGSRPFPIRAIQLRDKVERLSVSNLEKQSSYEAPLRFAGVEDQYFLTTALPAYGRGAQTVRVDYQPVTLPVPGDPQNRTRAFVGLSVHTGGPAALAFYAGPKDLDALRAVDPELTGAIDFGMFRFLVVPLLQALKEINRVLHNYGWSIVALTVLINLLIFPLRHRSMVSMRKMQAVQPEVKAIQDRYAKYKITDPERQKMNQEMMALYKQRGVNPASGCVPMLLTMPVLFAFYAMLSASIELRGAPFFGWLHDLSLKDPYYITPILMGATMFWQQRMMPSTADPVQQKMFMIMPVMFTVMFVAAPSGLVVYWLVSNLLAIGQQYITNRMIGAPARAARPLPTRPIKPAGKA